MIFSVICIKFALLIYFIHDVVSYPNSEVEDGGIKKQEEHSDGISDTEKNVESNKQKEGVIKGAIEYNDEKIEGSVELPSNMESEDENFHSNDDGTISGGGEFLKPEIDITESEADEDKSHHEDVIAGKVVEDDDGNIEGEIKVPDVSDSSSEYGNLNLDKINHNKGADGDVLSGSIEMDDNGNVEGTINVPGLDDVQQDTENTNRGESDNEDALTGSIEHNDDGVMGTINIPDDMVDTAPSVSGNPDVINGEVSGKVVIDDEGNVEGHVILDEGDVNSTGSENKHNNNMPSQSNHINDLETENRATTSKVDGNSCWLKLNGNQYLDTLDQLEAKYSKARLQYEEDIGADFDKKMIEVLLSSQGKAPRAIHQAHGNPNVIPAGLNLGGLGMLKMSRCMLFFHRMKLRNSTIFNVNFLHTSFMDMTIVARLALNDLHLSGVFERAVTKKNAGTMYFRPSHGELDVLIKNADYKMEGRLRMLNNRLMIETIYSELNSKQILVTYANSTISAQEITMQSLDDFMGRVKSDLDTWLKDYFNDYLMYFGIVNGGKNSEFQLYEKQKTIKANEYADNAIKGMKRKIRDLKAANVKLPAFTLLTIKNQRLQLKDGVLRGLDSMYRRSVAMTKRTKTIRSFDIMIGFSNLKVQYNYEGFIMRGTPPLAGLLILTADELTAHLVIIQVEGTETVDIHIVSLTQLKPESLTVEGPANRLIANFKYILENPIISLMTNVMKHNIKMLKTLTRCEPYLWGRDKHHIFIEEDDELTIHPMKKNPHNGYDKNINDDLEAATFSKETDEEKSDNSKDKGSSDYVFSKNDSVEVEVPVNGQVHKMNLKRNENFVLSKLP